MRVPSIAGAIGAIALAAALGCGPKPYATTEGAIPRCINLWPQGTPADTVRVALFDDVDPAHAPAWENDAERLVFHHLYETLPSGADWPCTKRSRLVEPPVRSGNTLEFTIRSDARFWDGAPVSARDVVASVGFRDSAFADMGSVIARDDRRVEVVAHGVDWAWLESSTRAIARPSNALWPIGTGLYRVDEADGFDDGLLTLQPVVGGGPVIRFIDARGVDPRDLLDPSSQAKFDIVAVRDRAVIDYAGSLQKFGNVALASNQGYLLLSFDRARAIERGDTLPTLNSLQSAFALDVVTHAYAQSIPDREWSRAVGRCNMIAAPPVPTVSTRSRRIVYDSSDPTARDLADRIASLSTSDPLVARALPGIAQGSTLVSVGLEPTALAGSLVSASDFAYVVAIRYEMPDICRSIEDLLYAAPWLVGNRPQLGDKVLPLVKTISLAFVEKPATGYGFDIVLDPFRRAMVAEADTTTPYR